MVLRSISRCLIISLSILTLAVLPSSAQASDSSIPNSYSVYEGRIVPTMLPHTADSIRRNQGLTKTRPGSPLRDLSHSYQVSYKLWRGVNNTLFGWMEIPMSVIEDTIRLDAFTGTVTGLTSGTADAVRRTGYGLIEILTFWDVQPGENPPLLYPEFVMDPVLD